MQICTNFVRRLGFSLALLTVGFLITSVGCSRKGGVEREVWAEVDGQPLYREQVEKIYRNRTAADMDAGGPEQALSLKLSILNELINNQILVTHASHSRVDVAEAEVDTRVAELESPYSKDEFQNKLRSQGLDVANFRQKVRESLIINKLITKEISSRVSVTDSEIATYYSRNKANFNVAETQYHLAQIEVTPFPDSEVRNLKNDDAKTPMDAERKIQALYARVRAGEDFAAVAQEYSEDPGTASGGGDMGFIPISTLNANPALKQAVTALKAGAVSPIIRTTKGYHIIKVLGIEQAGQHPLSDSQVQSAIRQALTNEKEQLLRAAYIEVLRNRSKVVNFLAAKIVNGEAVMPEQ